MKTMLLLAALTALSSCVTVEIEEVPGPDGEIAYEATCYDAGLAPCMKKAAKVCNGGKYEVLSRADSSAGGLVMAGGLYAESTATRLLFKCKDGPRKSKHESDGEEDYRLSW